MATMLAIAAHPDDETMFIGGTLAKYAAEGHTVYVLMTTRGEGGEVGEPALATPETLGAVREAEVRAACAALGVAEVRFLPFVDPRMAGIGGTVHHIDAPLELFAAAIRAQLEQLRPEVVLTHGSNGEYGHPQHIYTHRATQLALASLARPHTLATWGAWYADSTYEWAMNRDDPADLVLDITPWLAAKTAAAECHRTQHALFRRSNQQKQMAELVPHIESLHLWRGALPAE